MMRAPVLGKVVCGSSGVSDGGLAEDSNRATHFKHADSDLKGDSSAPERTLVVRNAPGIALERLEDARELELALLDGHEETRGTERRGRQRLSRTRDRPVRRVEAEHVLNLLRRVLL
jgi:hypothetical protein